MSCVLFLELFKLGFTPEFFNRKAEKIKDALEALIYKVLT